jgi:protein-disulfide isomerase
MISRRTILLSSLASAAAVPLAEHADARVRRVPTEIANDVYTLPGRVTLGNPRGDVTMVEFFDYNCGFCKNSARDIRPLLQGDPNLKYLLINYAVLGEASIEAARVALAHSMQKTQGGYLALHEALFQLRGRVGAQRAVDVAVSMGAKADKLIADADSDRVTDALTRATRLGDGLGLEATPSFLAGGEAVVGYLDLAAKRKAIANLRRCDKLGC